MPTYDVAMASNPAREHGLFGSGVVGFSPTMRSRGPLHQPGITVSGPGDQIWIYGLSAAASGTAATDTVPVAVAVTNTVVPAGGSGANAYPASATCAIATGTGFFAHAPFAAGDWGWVRKTAFI